MKRIWNERRIICSSVVYAHELQAHITLTLPDPGPVCSMGNVQRNSNFIGQADVIHRLTEKVCGRPGSAVAVCGLGGSGYVIRPHIQILSS